MMARNETGAPFGGGSGQPDAQVIQLTKQSWLELFPALLTPPEHEQLLNELSCGLPWEQRHIVLFGKRVPQPRLISWCGAAAYRYSGLTLEPRSVPPLLEGVVQRVSAATRQTFNHFLLNRYRDGRDGMGLHADNEAELGTMPQVATLSLGASRRFVLKARRGATRHQMELGPGSLLLMAGACQLEFVHGVPKSSRAVSERISITCRRVLEASG